MNYTIDDPDGSRTIESMKTLLRLTKYKDIPNCEKQIEKEVNEQVEEEIEHGILWLNDLVNNRIDKTRFIYAPQEYILNLLKHKKLISFDKDDIMNIKITENGLKKIEKITNAVDVELSDNIMECEISELV